MNSSHRVRVLGRELHVRSAASDETVREIESFVNEKVKEAAAASNSSDTQIIAILTLMNIAESYLTLAREHDSCGREGSARISRILQEMDNELD